MGKYELNCGSDMLLINSCHFDVDISSNANITISTNGALEKNITWEAKYHGTNV